MVKAHETKNFYFYYSKETKYLIMFIAWQLNTHIYIKKQLRESFSSEAPVKH